MKITALFNFMECQLKMCLSPALEEDLGGLIEKQNKFIRVCE